MIELDNFNNNEKVFYDLILSVYDVTLSVYDIFYNVQEGCHDDIFFWSVYVYVFFYVISIVDFLLDRKVTFDDAIFWVHDGLHRDEVLSCEDYRH